MKKSLFIVILFLFSLLCVTLAGAVVGGGVNCGNAVVVTPGTHTVIGPSGGGGASSCALNIANNAEWYSYTPTVNGVINVNSCGFDLDTCLYIHSTTCGGEDCSTGGDDDECPVYNAEIITGYPVTAAHTYYIEWTDYRSTATFDWQLIFTPDDAIPTLNEWGVIIMILMLSGGILIHRRRQAL